MRFYISIALLFAIISCERMVDKPKNLISKEKMSAIIADFALYDQSYYINPNTNMDLSARYVLKKHNINATTYQDSYKYYLSKPTDIDKILEDAKEIILDKDPKLQDYIKKKEKEDKDLPNFAK